MAWTKRGKIKEIANAENALVDAADKFGAIMQILALNLKDKGIINKGKLEMLAQHSEQFRQSLMTVKEGLSATRKLFQIVVIKELEENKE